MICAVLAGLILHSVFLMIVGLEHNGATEGVQHRNKGSSIGCMEVEGKGEGWGVGGWGGSVCAPLKVQLSLCMCIYTGLGCHECVSVFLGSRGSFYLQCHGMITHHSLKHTLRYNLMPHYCDAGAMMELLVFKDIKQIHCCSAHDRDVAQRCQSFEV